MSATLSRTLLASTSFVILGNPVTIRFESAPAQSLRDPNARTTGLGPVPANAMEYSFTGDMPGQAGQCGGTIRALAGKADAPDVARLCDLWASLHLNGMQAGTDAQTEALADMPEAKGDYFVRTVAHLEAKGLYVDRGYTYGSAWLYRELAPALADEACRIMERINGQRFGSTAEDGEDLKDAEFSNSDDTIDSRDIVARIEYLTDFLATQEEGTEAEATASQERDTLTALRDGLDDSEFDFGMTLVRDSYFEDYAREQADDMHGEAMRAASWPFNHIDWSAAADAMQQDYTSVEFEGVTYWAR